MNNASMIDKVEIKINGSGFYCINDLHKASGGDVRHRPSHWLRLGKTKAFVEEVLKSDIAQKCAITKKAGRFGGTFVCEQLVYSYAMWISPKFHLEVIDYFRINQQIEKGLSLFNQEIDMLSVELRDNIDSVCHRLDELVTYGSMWSCFGAKLKKAKKQGRDYIAIAADKLQLKLDLH